jgi:hypothetical protein
VLCQEMRAEGFVRIFQQHKEPQTLRAKKPHQNSETNQSPKYAVRRTRFDSIRRLSCEKRNSCAHGEGIAKQWSEQGIAFPFSKNGPNKGA